LPIDTAKVVENVLHPPPRLPLAREFLCRCDPLATWLDVRKASRKSRTAFAIADSSRELRFSGVAHLTSEARHKQKLPGSPKLAFETRISAAGANGKFQARRQRGKSTQRSPWRGPLSRGAAAQSSNSHRPRSAGRCERVGDGPVVIRRISGREAPAASTGQPCGPPHVGAATPDHIGTRIRTQFAQKANSSAPPRLAERFALKLFGNLGEPKTPFWLEAQLRL